MSLPRRSKLLLLLVGRATLVAAQAAVATLPWGSTFGNGLAGVSVCGKTRPPSIVVNHSLADDGSEPHGVLHHFWCTGAQLKIDRMWVEYYIDGETEPSIAFQPSMMCGMAFPTSLEKGKEYSASGLCGKSAPVGGWWNTFPIPFYKSVVVKLRADSSDGDGCFVGYVNIRGTANMPLVLPGSGLPLPLPDTRLLLQKNALAVRKPLEYVTVASLPTGQRGIVFQTAWAVESKPVGGAAQGGGYIEGCWQFYRQSNEPFPGLVVGTGVEDYFDSGYYFGADSGEAEGTTFTNALSGLTLFERTRDGFERLSAYRFHAADPLMMVDGGRLVWRVGAEAAPGKTKCGNPLLQPEHSKGSIGAEDQEGRADPSADGGGLRAGRSLSAVSVTTYAWVYTFAQPGAQVLV